MYRIIHGTAQNLPDVSAFVETLENFGEFFRRDREIFIARAPGRLDIMGGIADYSGSLVLQLPTAQAALVALQPDDSRTLKIISLGAADNDRTQLFEISLESFESNGKPINYEAAQKLFVGKTSWAAYIAGAFLVLMRERQIEFETGVKILLDSSVPEGKGVSSSAAVEVATMQAIAAAYSIKIETREMALLCQKVENLIVNAPCGVMDQMSSAGGLANQFLRMICQPAEVLKPLKIPVEIGFWGIDSGVRHSVGAGDYGSVRTGAFIGARIIADLAGFRIEKTEIDGFVKIYDTKWNNYLSNLPPAEFERDYAPYLPQEISGADFLKRYGGIGDLVTRVQADKKYQVFYPTAHPIYENARVHQFAEILEKPLTEKSLRALGRLMYESHASYSACGLGSNETDSLVQLAQTKKDVYGAKITGGGSGGTVAVLGLRGADASVKEIADEYAVKTNYRPFVFSNSSMGAANFGHLKVIWSE